MDVIVIRSPQILLRNLKFWTENWSGWFLAFGGAVPCRPAEDHAFLVARFYQRGGTFQNYYMYNNSQWAVHDTEIYLSMSKFHPESWNPMQHIDWTALFHGVTWVWSFLNMVVKEVVLF